MEPANKARGEVAVTLGDLEIVLAAEMGQLGRLSALTGHPTFPELYSRLVGTEISTTMAALRLLTVRGQRGGKDLKRDEAADAAAEAFRLDDAEAVQSAFQDILAGLMRPAPDDNKKKDRSKN